MLSWNAMLFKDSNPVRWGGMVRKLLHIFQTDVSRRCEDQGCHVCSCLLWACSHATQVTCQPDLLDGSVCFPQGKLGCSSSSFPPPPNGHQLLENEELIKMYLWTKMDCLGIWRLLLLGILLHIQVSAWEHKENFLHFWSLLKVLLHPFH